MPIREQGEPFSSSRFGNAAFSHNSKPLSAWTPYREYDSADACTRDMWTLHADLFPTDEDLSKRVLDGLCRSKSSGQIKKAQDAPDEDE